MRIVGGCHLVQGLVAVAVLKAERSEMTWVFCGFVLHRLVLGHEIVGQAKALNGCHVLRLVSAGCRDGQNGTTIARPKVRMSNTLFSFGVVILSALYGLNLEATRAMRSIRSWKIARINAGALSRGRQNR